MAVGNSSMRFIAWCARRGMSDGGIRAAYDFLQKNGTYLTSTKVDRWRLGLAAWHETLTDEQREQWR